MWDIPSARFMETYEFIKWSAKHWKLLMSLHKSSHKPQEADETFLENSIQLIETFQKEKYHMCIFSFLMENMSPLSDSICSAFFQTATWLVDEERVNYFENTLLRALKEQLAEKKKSHETHSDAEPKKLE